LTAQFGIVKSSNTIGFYLPALAVFACLISGEVICAETNSAIKESLERIAGNSDYVDLSTIPGIVIDLKYASLGNFMKENLYGDFRKAFLHKVAVEKFMAATEALQKLRPGWKLLVFDALRPRSVQQLFWNRVKGTPQQPYVANPDKGSMHNFGFAVDLSLLDDNGKELDMGSKYDDFSKMSEPALEQEFIRAGRLTEAQVNNRRILRRVMTGAGFSQQSNEWWHFDALPANEVRANYVIVE
jgi:D-alanyl-D-alanine dipeptidase